MRLSIKLHQLAVSSIKIKSFTDLKHCGQRQEREEGERGSLQVKMGKTFVQEIINLKLHGQNSTRKLRNSILLGEFLMFEFN